MLKSILINNISQSLQFGARWILNIILLRSMSIQEFGLFSFLYSISNILSSILPFGSSVYIFKENNKDGKEYLVIDSFVIIFLLFVIILFIYILIFIFDFKFRGSDYIVYPMVLGLFLSLNIVFSSYLKSMNQFIKELKVYFLFSLLLFGFISYIYSQKQVTTILVFQILIILNFIITVIFANKLNFKIKLLSVKQSLNNYKLLFHDRLYYGLQEVQTAIYGQSSMIILFYLLSSQLYGVYRSLFILIMPISLISYSMTQVFINYLKNNMKDINNKFRKISLFSLIVSIIIVSTLFLLKGYLLELVNIDIKYSILFIYLFILVSFQLLNSSYSALLIVLNRQKIRFYGTLISSILVIISMFTFINDTSIGIAIVINVLATIILSFVYIISAEICLRKKRST